jgi:Dolichyl-phosphate-mannose-protein mannosyltransferase
MVQLRRAGRGNAAATAEKRLRFEANSRKRASMTQRGRSILLLALLLGSILVVRIATIRAGHDWGDDFAQYIAHAGNLASGRAYTDTGYIYDHHNASIGPAAYPPGFPLLLTPVVAVVGENLHAMKILLAIIFVAMLAVGYALFGGVLPNWQRLSWVAIVGFSPVWLRFGNEVTSDIPFLLFFFLVFWAEKRAGDTDASSGRPDLRSVVLGVAIFAAIATRTIGIVFVPALLLCELVAHRRITRCLLIALLVAVGLVALETRLVPGSGCYLEQLKNLPHGLPFNLRNYPPYFRDFFFAGPTPLVVGLFTGWLAIVAAFGFVRRALSSCSLLETATAGYLAIILLWPNFQGLRLLLPLFLLFAFYLLVGLNELAARLPKPNLAPTLTALVTVALGVIYLWSFAHADYGPIRGVEDADAQGVFAWVRGNADPDDVVLCQKPRALALYAHRGATGFPEAADDRDMVELIRRNKVRYVVVGHGVWPEDAVRERELAAFVARCPALFQERTRSGRFAVYQWLDPEP